MTAHQRPNACHVATLATPDEQAIYRSIRDLLITAHCAAKGEHPCCGAITLTRDAILLQCPLCGDLKQIIG